MINILYYIFTTFTLSECYYRSQVRNPLVSFSINSYIIKNSIIENEPAILPQSDACCINIGKVIDGHIFNDSIVEYANFTSFIPTGNEICFVIQGEPQALSRHRHLLNSKITYNPSAKLQKQFVKDSSDYLPVPPLSGPLEVSLLFYFSRPKMHYRTGKLSGVLKTTAPIFHNGAKDIDNLVKFVLDSLNAKAYLDDRQVVSLHSYKFYTNLTPRVVVMIKSLSN